MVAGRLVGGQPPEPFGNVVELLLHGAECRGGLLLIGVEALHDRPQRRFVLGACLARHRGVAFMPGNGMELLGDLFQPQGDSLAVVLVTARQGFRSVGWPAIAALEVVAAFGRLEDHAVEPLANRHSRLPGSLLGCRARLLFDALDAPRDARLHVMPLSLGSLTGSGTP
jgi:hypothetical protein